jgi:signal transduction histidine kinase
VELATRSPNADGPAAAPRPARRSPRILPRTFQGRLTLGFVAVIVLTLTLVSALVIKSLDDSFYSQEQVDLGVRATTVRDFVVAIASDASAGRPVVTPENVVDPAVAAQLAAPATVRFLADRAAQANVQIRIGSPTTLPGGTAEIIAAPSAVFSATLAVAPSAGQSREHIAVRKVFRIDQSQLFSYAVEITLSDPYTFKASTLRDIASQLLVIAIVVLGLAVVLASVLTRRFTTPLRRLTEAARRLAQGDLTSRVPAQLAQAGGAEIANVSLQFNAMAAQLEESVEIIRRDRDRSRDFLADVSHELRTPLAALRTFNELLLEQAGHDPDTRAEFLQASGQQIERLDWLAQNLLELSKLDSGLVLLDLRPEDLRAAVESAVEQADAAARRRGVQLALHLPPSPVRIRHDPQRIGQVVTNLVGNALKFTPRGGSVDVELRATADGAEIEVRDTGVGIDPGELPHVFERFFRGSRANEARGSGSGLGLAIVKSIVDMHGGRTTVESRLGAGTTFMVTLPRDPRAAAVTTTATAQAADAATAPAAATTTATARPAAGDSPAVTAADAPA